MSRLAAIKKEALAAKDREIAARDSTIATRDLEIVQLRGDLKTEEKQHEKAMNYVCDEAVNRTAKLEKRKAQVSLLRCELRDMRARRDSAMSVEYCRDVIEQWMWDYAALERENDRLVREEKWKRMGLMRACVKDLEIVSNLVSREDRVGVEGRIGQWRGRVEELQREMSEE